MSEVHMQVDLFGNGYCQSCGALCITELPKSFNHECSACNTELIISIQTMNSMSNARAQRSGSNA